MTRDDANNGNGNNRSNNNHRDGRDRGELKVLQSDPSIRPSTDATQRRPHLC